MSLSAQIAWEEVAVARKQRDAYKEQVEALKYELLCIDAMLKAQTHATAVVTCDLYETIAADMRQVHKLLATVERSVARQVDIVCSNTVFAISKRYLDTLE
jgi:hypothetical protein